MFTYDRQIIISIGASRNSKRWQPQTLLISEHYERLRTPARSTETLAEFLSYKKPQQDELKDVGGYLGGALKGSRRKADAVVSREFGALDADNAPAGSTENILQCIDSLGCGYCVHSTRKYTRANPRLRIIIPFDRAVTPDEYEPVIRKLAQYIDPSMTMFDPTTFEANRLMFWPSCSADSEYVYYYTDKPLVSADGLLATYGDWHDMNSWPQVPGAAVSPQKLAAKQGDPLTKPGVVGAFCRTYSVYDVMDKFLPGIYEPTDIPDRYTYTGGSTTGGTIVYDNGKFLYSHHATDPCSSKLVNAWDLTKTHKFGYLDDDAKEGTKGNRLPSYIAMCEFALSLPEVSALLNKEQYEAAATAFGETEPVSDNDDSSWMQKLTRNSNGSIDHTSANIALALENDPRLRDRIYCDTFADRTFIIAPVPWGDYQNEKGQRPWRDADEDGLVIYLEGLLKFRSPQMVKSVFNDFLTRHSVNPVTDYFNSLVWDGVPRLDTLYVDYLGAEDSEYVRAVTRKAFTAAVTRTMRPGTKFDTMSILSGRQGLYKSTLIAKMGGEWFCDSIISFEGKEFAENIQGKLLIEIPELQAFSKTDTNRIKQVLSMQDDYYRAPYGHKSESHPRRCVFFGTTNAKTFLRDFTGGRRFWPVYVGIHPPTKDVSHDLDGERDQIWAEAVVRWRLGEPLYLSEELVKIAEQFQEEAREANDWEGLIFDFIEKPIPADWDKWDISRRCVFWNNSAVGEIKLVLREKVCVLEIWCELFGKDKAALNTRDSRTINEILGKAEGWERIPYRPYFGPYGRQRGFEKIQDKSP